MSRQSSSGAGSRSGSPAATARRLRLQRILADAGIASRRGAERFLREGRVEVNGRVASLGDSADPDRDVVRFDGRVIASQRKRYWLLNKPLDVLTTTRDPQGRSTVIDLLPADAGRVVPVGRLDRDTEGLLLLTNDGPLIQRLLHPSHGNEREYRVTLSGEVDAACARRVERGVPLEDGNTARARVTRRRYDARGGTTTPWFTGPTVRACGRPWR